MLKYVLDKDNLWKAFVHILSRNKIDDSFNVIAWAKVVAGEFQRHSNDKHNKCLQVETTTTQDADSDDDLLNYKAKSDQALLEADQLLEQLNSSILLQQVVACLLTYVLRFVATQE